MALGISLIISVSNQGAQLRKILATLARHTPPAEILVAEDGEAPETPEIIREAGARYPALRIRHLRQASRGFRKTIVLNRAIADSTAEYVIFLDGDCVPHPDFIRDHARLAKPGCFVQGRRAYIRESRVPEFLSGSASLPKLFLTGGMHGLAKGIRLPLPIIWEDTRLRGTLGCNFAAWRADLLAVDGHDESFVGWGKEDSDLAARLIHLGRTRRLVHNQAIVYHLDHPLAPRDGLNPNEARLADTLRTRRIRAVAGLSSPRNPAPDSPPPDSLRP